MKKRIVVVIAAFMIGVTWVQSAPAHDPDALELEVPEVSVIGERPIAASSQQFIPDK